MAGRKLSAEAGHPPIQTTARPAQGKCAGIFCGTDAFAFPGALIMSRDETSPVGCNSKRAAEILFWVNTALEAINQDNDRLTAVATLGTPV